MRTMHDYIIRALKAALDAGTEILEVYAGEEFDVRRKDDNSPLTLADRRAHEAIEKALAPAGLPLLSEEGADTPPGERKSWDLYYLIDPLDGTKEFIKRNGEFTVNIALMAPSPAPTPEKGPDSSGCHRPAGGVVYVPVTDTLYLGLEGRGAWKLSGSAARMLFTLPGALPDAEECFACIGSAGTPLPGEDPHSRPFTAVMSRSHNSPESEEFLSRLETEHGPAERVSSGSSIKLCLVAEGAADVYPRFAPTMEWDTAAGDAVCRAAGCRVTGADGRTPLCYNKEDLHNPYFVVQGPRLGG